MTNAAPTIECDGTALYVCFAGVRIAKRGRLGTADALQWVPIVAGVRVRNGDGDEVEVGIEIEENHGQG